MLSGSRMKTLALLLLCLVGTNSIAWDGIKRTEESLRGFQESALQVFQTVEQVLQNTTSESAKFIDDIDDIPIVKDVSSLPELDKCKISHKIDVTELRHVFNFHFSQLQEPLQNRMSEIKGRFKDVLASIAVYQGLADSKWWTCKLQGNNCLDDTKAWIQENMDLLLCKVIAGCKAHRISKRSSCELGHKEINGECMDINYICDGDCHYSSCGDENNCKPCFGKFRCENLDCISKMDICNGIDDCGDGSDEEGCSVKEVLYSPVNCSLESGNFLCDNRKCVTISDLCDGKDNCGDGSDEGGYCGESACDPGCSAAGGVCFGSPRGSTCLSHCPPGTSETPLGCALGPKLPPSTIEELLGDVPRLITRYLAGVKGLQRRTIEEVAKSISKISECKSDKFPTLNKIMTLDLVKPPHTTTHKPHTTTHKPHTTTHHTTTQEPDGSPYEIDPLIPNYDYS